MKTCENCGKEHDGSYGSGRFCCKHCRMVYIGKNAHKTQIKNGTFKSGFSLGKNLNHKKATYGTWKCNQCNLIFETRSSLRNHNNEYHSNYDENGNKIAWNKGKTKETDPRIAINAKHVQEAMKKLYDSGYVGPAQNSEYWTEEKRKEQSERKKKLYAEHPEKHPNRKVAGNREKMTYPEQIVFDWLNEHNIDCIHNYYLKSDAFTRFVDFFIPSKKLIIEVDGEYWHQNKEIDNQKDTDAKQTFNLDTLRISPKERIIDKLQIVFSV